MKGNHLHIKNHDNLIKDTRTAAVISINDNAYNTALSRKKRDAEYNQLKNDVADLKDMVSLLIQKLDK